MAYVPFAYDGEDADTLLADALTRIADALPGWTPNEAHVEYAVLSEMVRFALETRLLASDVADAIFRSYGEKLIALPPQPGIAATADAVFTFTDTAVHTVPAGTQVLWPTGGDPILFATVAAVSNTAGSATTPAVQIAAVEPGLAANGLAPATLDLIDAISFVASVASTTTSGGGQDPESDAAYLDRLTDSLRLLRRIPVLAEDFSVLARDIPGVYRALGLDNYNPADGTTNNERMIAVAPVAEDGTPVPTSVRTELQTRLDSEREVNFVVNTLDPTYTALTVTFTAEADPDADAATVLADAVQAVEEYLSPAAWGGGDERPPVWRYQPTVRYLDIVGVIASTPGLRHVVDVTLNGGTANVTLAGAAPLPAADPTVTGTVT
jgi:hypothetical protein